MPSSGDGTAWDVTIPTDSGEVSDTGLEMREIKEAVGIRLDKEHTTFATSSSGGEHKKGSGVLFIQSSYPTLRPDGVTTLDTNDAGRCLIRNGAGEGWMEYWDGSAWQKIRMPDSAVTPAHVSTGFADGILSYAIYANQLGATDTTEASGTFNSGAWQTRVLNTEVFDSQGIGSLATNRITLAAGTYRVRAKAPALQVNYHQIRFRNITDSTTIEFGAMSLSGASDTTQTYSELVAEFTIGHTVAFELQHRCSDSKATVGFGAGPGTFGTVWYTSVVEITKLK